MLIRTTVFIAHDVGIGQHLQMDHLVRLNIFIIRTENSIIRIDRFRGWFDFMASFTESP